MDNLMSGGHTIKECQELCEKLMQTFTNMKGQFLLRINKKSECREDGTHLPNDDNTAQYDADRL